ncbi:MAG: iron-containing redox enzyme family protein [Planctomycetaceae bacterium]
MTSLPEPRGDLSHAVFARLRRPPGALGPLPAFQGPFLAGDDLHLTLFLLQELSYGGFDDVQDDWECEPTLMALRNALETAFADALRQELGAIVAPAPADVSEWLVELSRAPGPPLSRFLAREATAEQFREFVIHRSAYTLKEADPHTFAIPRLRGRAKAALVEIQADEYGGGRVEDMHAEIFAATMRALELDDTPNAYLDRIPGSTLATVNLVGMFGGRRRWRGAAAGHLALFELTSSIPNRAYGNGLRRMGFGEDATHYYDEHVEADSVHDMIAAYDLVGALVREEPGLTGDVVFGASALELLERRFATVLLDAWGQRCSSLLPSGAVAAVSSSSVSS